MGRFFKKNLDPSLLKKTLVEIEQSSKDITATQKFDTQLHVLWKDWAQCMRMFQLRLETTVKITYGNVV